MRRFTSLLGNAVQKLAEAGFFRLLLVLDILWVLAWVVGLTYNESKLFSVISLVVGLVGVLVPLSYFLITGRAPADVLPSVVRAVDTNRVLQGGILLVIPITIVFWSFWPRYDWCDRFNGTEIDGNRWRVQSDPDLIDVRGGVLNFEAVAGRSQGETGGGLLARVPEDREIEEVSFTTALKSWEGNGTGGAAGVGLNLENGRDIAFKVGPGPDGEPEGEFWACKTFSCGSIGSGDYYDYGTDSSNFRKDGEATPIRVVQTDERIEFYIDGEPREFYPEDELFEEAKPIVGFGFTSYADEGSEFRLTIDDVCVEYADS